MATAKWPAESTTFLWGGSGVYVEGVVQGTPLSNPTGSGFMSEQYQVRPVSDPTQIPTVSANYPQNVLNQGGTPVQFTFGANGVSDVAGYEYDWQQVLSVIGVPIGDHGIPQPTDPYSDPKHFARATTLGDSATASLIPPEGSGVYVLWVRSLDLAGNPSDETSYMFDVKYDGPVDASPTVSSDVYAENASSGGTGVPGTFSFAPKVKGVASYTYSFNWGTPTTVKASAGGSAQISWTPPQSGWYDLEVYATTKDGIQLTPYDYYFTVN